MYLVSIGIFSSETKQSKMIWMETDMASFGKIIITTKETH